MERYGWKAGWELTESSICLSGKFNATDDASWYAEPSINIEAELRGSQLILEADVSMATSYVYLQKKLTGNWWNIDSSLVFDASLTTTSYIKEYTGLVPTMAVRAVIPADTSNAVTGVIDVITLRNVL